MAITILAIGLFVFAAFLFKGVFNRTGIPDVLLLMVCGIVIGPLTGWVVPEAFGQAGSVLASPNPTSPCADSPSSPSSPPRSPPRPRRRRSSSSSPSGRSPPCRSWPRCPCRSRYPSSRP